MSKKPGLYANIHAKRKRGEKMRKPGEEGAPSAQDFKNAAKTAKKKKGAKREDPGRKMYDKDGCKMCDGGKKPCRCGKADMGRKGPYADGMCKRGDIAAEFNAVLINDAERSDKPCGNSYIPEAAKCNKGRGTAKASPESLKKRALAKEREVNKGRGKKKVTGRQVLGTYLGTMSAIAGVTQAAQAGQALAKGQYGKAFGSAAQAAGNLSGANAFASGNIGRGFKRQMFGNAAGLGSYLGGEAGTGYKRARAKGARPLNDLIQRTRERSAGVRRMPRR